MHTFSHFYAYCSLQGLIKDNNVVMPKADHHLTPDDVTTDATAAAAVCLVKPTSSISHVIVDCSSMSYVDAPGMSTLSQAIEEYANVGVTVLLAGCKGTSLSR